MITRRNHRKVSQDRLAFRASGERLDPRVMLTGVTVIVDKTSDAPGPGGGTLRAAIAVVDSMGDPVSPNSIVFRIPKSDPGYNPLNETFTFLLTAELPSITNPVLLDGTTESKFLGQPAQLVIDGSVIKVPADGLTLAPSAPGSTIDGLEITHFDGSGIVVESANNTIGGTTSDSGNILVSNITAGVSIAPSPLAPGTASHNVILGNFVGTDSGGDSLGNGVGISVGTASNTIGGITSADANVIGFNSSAGVEITGAGAINNVVLGNFIGTSATGLNLGNSIGVSLETASNTIGGSSAGSANVFGFSSTAGLQIDADNEVVIGNLFGTTASGANAGNAVGVLDNFGRNTIGGNSPGTANVFGFNSTAGLQIGGTNEVVIGNLFGTNSSGANLRNTVGVLDGVGGNTIGGTSTGAANLFAFNTAAGLQVGGTNELVIGNQFGTTAGGANLGNSVGVLLTAGGSTIGGSSAAAANVFGFNTTAGLEIAGATATDEFVIGNLFGATASGANVGNAVGVLLEAGSNTIGGTSTGEANVFGFNTATGIQITGTSDVVVGNLFGISGSGASIGNAIGTSVSGSGNTIGGTAAGAANVFAFNTAEGLLIAGSGASGNIVLGNFVGTDSNGVSLGNTIGLNIGSAGNTIGGTTLGSANVIGFNNSAGIVISGTAATGNAVLGNFIGTNSAGANLGETVGVVIGSAGNVIGGTAPGSANVVGFSSVAGAVITGASATGNVLTGNFFGTNASGANLGNTVGVAIGSAGNVIGGTVLGSANIFAFSSAAGVTIAGPDAAGNVLLGNFIGTNASGANFGNGIGVVIGSAGNTIGGATLGAGNVISLNSTAGVQLIGTGASANVLLSNLIGTDPSGQVASGNGVGVIVSGGTGNVIGATTAGAGNVISGNFTAGIELAAGSAGTRVVGNKIGTNEAGTSAVVRANQPDPLTALQNAGIAIIGSVGNVVGGSGQAGNLISGNYVGVNLATIPSQVTPNLVAGNLIGTNASGANPLGNIVGIYVNGSPGNQIGAPGMPNTVSGNRSVGVEIYGSGSTGNVLEANIIGLAANGRTAMVKANGQFVQPTGVFILNASGNVIGGPSSGTGNVISGNQSAAVYILSRSGTASGNIVQRNLVGLAQGGARGPGNNGYGVLVLNSPNNSVVLKGPAGNRFGRNRIANFRKLTGTASASPIAAKGLHSRAIHLGSPGLEHIRKQPHRS